MSAERRIKSRNDVAKLMPVRIVEELSGAAVSCRIEDVSAEGLGVVSQAALATGLRLVFETLDQAYAFEVAWCRQDGVRTFKSGLRLVEPGKDLDRLFSGLIAHRGTG